MKILIIRFSSIGDIVLTTPVLRCLKKQLPDVELHFLTKAAYKSLVENNPYVDKIQLLSHSLLSTVAELKKENYDLIIDLHHNLRTFAVKALLGVKSYSFRKLNIEKWLYVHFKINRLPKVHIVDRYLDTVKHLNVKNDGEGLDYFVPLTDEISLPTPYIAWVLGAKFTTKRFPVQKVIATLNRSDFPANPIVLIGGKEDKEAAQQIMNGVTNPSIQLTDATGKYNLNQSASILQQSTAVLTNDTGMMHIAAAFRKPIITLWGNTVPDFGMYPYLPNADSQSLEVSLNCRPCSKIGHDSCPKGHFKCMLDVREEEVVNALKKVLR